MKRFVESVARDQGGLFPAHREDFVAEDNRRLEGEARRNVVLMRLTELLAPDHKTIATSAGITACRSNKPARVGFCN